jgi:aminoglycoside phosphotransferase (APT) family kinase protein
VRFERSDVETRIGRTTESIELLSGGLANLNVRVGRDRVLRIHRRQPGLVAKEAALLSRGWHSFRVPRVIETGDDFLVLEYIEHTPLEASAEHGALAGRALAEIHSIAYSSTGLLGADLSLERPFPEDGFSILDYGKSQLERARTLLDPAFSLRVVAFLEANNEAVSKAMGTPVLVHCDYKASNLHITNDGELLVLDWEFAWAGPRLLDVGQLLRWHPPKAFAEAFADSYRADGGVLADEWRRSAEAIDLCNLLGLSTSGPGERRRADISSRIEETLAQQR